MMLDIVRADLAKQEITPFHGELLEDCKALVALSRRTMTQRYTTWDKNNDIYNGILNADKKDRDAASRGEPTKMVVPIAYAQTQTFVSFCYSLFTQRERIFELVGNALEDHKAARIGEALLARDLSHNCFEAKLYQFLLDISRYGIGVIKSGWVVNKQMTKMQVEIPPTSLFGLSWLGSKGRTEEIEQEVTKYAGNQLYSISPYRFFPDPRLPLARFQEGEFVASEDEFTTTTMHQMEHEGSIVGVEFIPQLNKRLLEARGETRTSSWVSESANAPMGDGKSLGSVILTEVQRSIVPSKYKIDGNPLGPENYPVKYNIWYANDSRIVKCEPLGYAHGEYTYDVAQFSCDQGALVNPALSDTIDQLQSVISWFINSRIASVRSVIGNRMVIDPSGVEWKDVKERSAVIRLKPEVGARGIDRYIKQLDVQDVTTNHINDAEYLFKLVQLTTGITDNVMGQYNQGRRSATEARNSMSSAASRLKMIAAVIFRTGLEPLGRKMLSNLRDGLDAEQVVRVVGLEPLVEGGSFLPVSKKDLVGNYDFEVFDGTLPSEKGYIATALQEVLMLLAKNPQAAISLGIDPRSVLLEQLELRGVRNPERFTLKAPPPEVVDRLQQTPGTAVGSQQGTPAQTPGNETREQNRKFGGSGNAATGA